MKIKIKLLFVLISILLETSNLYAMKRIDNPSKQEQEKDYVTNRRMFPLTPEYRDKNQILMIKELSSVMEFAGRHFAVIKLIDDSEVPFYKSTGSNSGLPNTWLPFFGLWEDGWFHKNETFNHDHPDPLYHSGCYVLAQVANELDKLLPNVKPSFIFPYDSEKRLSVVSCINSWIGGVVLDPDKMPQDTTRFKKTKFRQLSPVPDEGVNKYKVVDTVATLGRNLFGFFKNKQERKKDVVACDHYFSSSLAKTNNSYLTQNPFIKPFFLKEITNTAAFVHDLNELMQRMDKFHANEKNPYVKEYKAFKELVGVTLKLDEIAKTSKTLPDKFKAYLSLQMLKRFSFNYVYKMLSEIAENPKYSEELYERAIVPSRAVWVMIKHNRRFEDYQRNNLIRNKLLEIVKNSPLYFKTLCMEKPATIAKFLNKKNYDTDDTEVEEHTFNKDLLENMRIKASEIYETSDFELLNLHVVIEKGYHKMSFAEIVEHYNQPNYLLGIKGVTHEKDLETLEKNLADSLKTTQDLRKLDNERSREPKLREVLQKLGATSYIILSRLVIPDMLNKLRQLPLHDYKDYISAFDGLLFLKNIFQGSDASEGEKIKHTSLSHE